MVIFLIVSICRQSLGVLRFNTKTRYSASECLDHDWFKINSKQCEDQSKEKPSENILKNILKYKSVSELRRKAMNILVKTLSSKEINEIRKEFEKIDVDNSGTIEASELSAALEKAGLKLPAEKFNKIFDEVDIDKNHKINYSEFIAATLDVREFLTESKLYHLFRIFDVDNSGYITIENMNEAFSKMDEMKMQEHEIFFKRPDVAAILEKHDTEKDGKISFDEFKQMMLMHEEENSNEIIKS